jgi:hypothetical protein
VAWPMPRLAPVRSIVRRGVLAKVGINGLSHYLSCPVTYILACAAGHPRLDSIVPEEAKNVHGPDAP